MAAYLVIERPKHGPHVLGVVKTRQDAEVLRRKLIAGKPGWASVLSIRVARSRTA